MKKLFILILLISIAVPQLALAVWWNPLTWFDKTPQTQTKKETINNVKTIPKNVTYYIKSDNTRIRTCPSLTCDILGYYHQDTTVILESTLETAPEWILLDFENKERGYINKSVLSDRPSSVRGNDKTNKQSGFQSDLTTPQNSTVFYVSSPNAEVRKYDSMSCEVIDHMELNGEITIPKINGTKIVDIAEWQPITINGQNGFFHKSVISEKPVETLSPKVVESNNTQNNPTLKEITLSELSKVIDLSRALEREYSREITYLNDILGTLQGESSSVTKVLADYTKIRKSRLEKGQTLAKAYADLLVQRYNEYKTHENSFFYKNEKGPLTVESREFIKTALDRFTEDSENYSGYINKYKSQLNNTESQNREYTSPSHSSTNIYECGPWITICGTENFNPDDYHIVTGPDSYGGTLYKVVPPQGAKVPNLGYFESESRAIESYKTWLKNNGY